MYNEIEDMIGYFEDIAINGSGVLPSECECENVVCSYSCGVIDIHVYVDGVLRDVIAIDTVYEEVRHNYDTDESCVTALQELYCPF